MCQMAGEHVSDLFICFLATLQNSDLLNRGRILFPNRRHSGDAHGSSQEHSSIPFQLLRVFLPCRLRFNDSSFAVSVYRARLANTYSRTMSPSSRRKQMQISRSFRHTLDFIIRSRPCPRLDVWCRANSARLAQFVSGNSIKFARGGLRVRKQFNYTCLVASG